MAPAFGLAFTMPAQAAGPIGDEPKIELRVDNPSPLPLNSEGKRIEPNIFLSLDDDMWEYIHMPGGSVIWVNSFSLPAASFPFELEVVKVVFPGTASLFDPFRIAVYEDCDMDANPGTGGILRHTEYVTPLANDGQAWSDYYLATPILFDQQCDIAIGVINDNETAFEVPLLDTTSPQGRSWIGQYATFPFAPPDPLFLPPDATWQNVNNLIPPIPGNWMIRGGGNQVCLVECEAHANPQQGVVPHTVHFSADATLLGCVGPPTYSWTFGDGAVSSAQNPSHTYGAIGTYTWSMTVTADGVTCVQTGTVYVLPPEPCSLTCFASASPTSGRAPLTVSFTSSSTAENCTGSVTRLWNFGDGENSGDQNPTHTYPSPGNYTWSFTAAIEDVTCTRSGVITVTDPCTVECTATADPESGVAPLTVNFTATGLSSCGSPVDFLWTLEDGTSISGAAFSHTFTDPGDYDWTLTAGADGATCTKTGTVTVNEPCVLTCSGTANPVTGTSPLAVDFTSTIGAQGCTGPVTVAWDFGDGTGVSDSNPTHTYGQPGDYVWTLTVTADGETCIFQGTIHVDPPPCVLGCTAGAAPPQGSPPLTVDFDATVTATDCGSVLTNWDFGDGDTTPALHVTHTYDTAGTYTWTFSATADGETCFRTGTVLVQAPGTRLEGDIYLDSGGGLALLDGPGILAGTVKAIDIVTGAVTFGTIENGHYTVAPLQPGGYDLTVQLTYIDHISYDADHSGYGCPGPPGGTATKNVFSTPMTIDFTGTGFYDVHFPPPLVMLHGILDCYGKWFSWDTGDPDFYFYWDNFAREAGFFSFTPNYHWWGTGSSWSHQAQQVAGQIEADLLGLSAAVRAEGDALPPYILLGHDMGGMVARVLAAGSYRDDPVVRGMLRIYLIGTPNSGSDFLLGGGPGDPLSESAIIERFNEIYPDFGNRDVYGIGGNHGWWGQTHADGPVTLYSAFTVTRLACTSAKNGDPECTPYPALVLDSGDGHVFYYTHGELGSPASAQEILDLVVLSAWDLIPTAGRTRPESRPGEPESPAGAVTWGTVGRTSGGVKGTVQSRAPGSGPEAEYFFFRTSATDGLVVQAFAEEGEAEFGLVDPMGTSLSIPPAGLHVVNPPSGQWTLRVTPETPSVTFQAWAAENSPFGILSSLTRTYYLPQETATLWVGLDGDWSGTSVETATAELQDSTGAVLQTIDLTEAGGVYTGIFDVPATPGSYPVRVDVGGLYQVKAYSRVSFTTLYTVPELHLFTGDFVDQAKDRDGDGTNDALAFTSRVALNDTGDYVVRGALFDGQGNFVARASVDLLDGSPGTFDRTLVFPMDMPYCTQLTAPFQVKDLEVVDAGTLAPLDAWRQDVPTQIYDAGDFPCAAGEVDPEAAAVHPDEVFPGQNLQLRIGGTNFQDGALLTFDAEVDVNGVAWMDGEALVADVSVSPQAAVGKQGMTVTNPDGGTGRLENALEIIDDLPPRVSFTNPPERASLDGSAAVTAAATDEVRVNRVEFYLDGILQFTANAFPFQWEWDTAGVPDGTYNIEARAFDPGGKSGTATLFVGVRMPILPGDCDWSGRVSIGEVQRAINMFLGVERPDCGVDENADGQVSIGEVQRVINAFLGG